MGNEREINCDVLVVGGGPAGASAALSSVKQNADTILIEKRADFDTRACAEGIGEYLLPLLPFDIPQRHLKWRIEGIRFASPNFKLKKRGGFFRGWSINRPSFDEWLLNRAAKAGADIRRPCELIQLNMGNGNRVEETICKDNDGIVRISPDRVIAADGVNSTVANQLGIYREDAERGMVQSWEMTDLELQNPRFESMYFGDFAPGAYGYIFPKSQTTANIGVGTRDENEDLEALFNRFIENRVSNQTRSGTKVVEKSGSAPFQYKLDDWQYNNVLLAGDAADQNLKPYVEGVLPAIICGDIAGRVAANKRIDDYRSEVMSVLGGSFKQSDQIVQALRTVDQISEPKRYALQLFLFAYLDPGGFERLTEHSLCDIHSTITRGNKFLSTLLELFAYRYWKLKVGVFGRDRLFK